MKRLLGYIIGILTLLVVFAMVFVAGGIYDNSDKMVIEPYFFRTALTGVAATDVPRSVDEIGQRWLRDRLIQKFVNEYFYVVPDTENIAQRENAGQFSSVIYYMSYRNSDVFKNWVKNEVPKIRQLAEDGVMRTVTVFDEISKINPDSDYYRVEYELKTWYKSNDMDTSPEVSRGHMYIHLVEGPNGIRPIENLEWAFDKGANPAFLFTFWVDDVKFEGE